MLFFIVLTSDKIRLEVKLQDIKHALPVGYSMGGD